LNEKLLASQIENLKMERFSSSPDCEKLMDEFTEHDEKVIRGSIVQLYYYVRSYNMIKIMDDELTRLAAQYGGRVTAGMFFLRNLILSWKKTELTHIEQGIHHWRRDIDFEFPSIEEASRFSEKINNTARFFIHSGLNVLGEIVPKPTIEELQQKREELKKINCGSN
jgi:hypothetical protein